MEKDEGYLQLIDGVKYAEQTGSFNIINLVNKSKNVCVFGLGRYFREAFIQQNVKEKYSVNLLCDNNKEKVDEVIKEYGFKDIQGISVLDLAKIPDVVVIVMVGDSRNIITQLHSLGIKNVFNYAEVSLSNIFDMPKSLEWFKLSENKIFETYKLLEEKSKKIYSDLLCNRFNWNVSKHSYEKLTTNGEYFTTDVFKLNENESFIDCGAYNGDTIESFLKATNSEFNAIYGFEMDEKNYCDLVQKVNNLESEISSKINCYNCGVFNENKEITYGCGTENDPSEGISIYKTDNCKKAKVIKLDDMFSDINVTLIKMDIEGSELKALQGAENIIKKNKPKLAICIYHKVSDFWEIPLYLKSLVPEYKIEVRHHNMYDFTGTVCYAHI